MRRLSLAAVLFVATGLTAAGTQENFSGLGQAATLEQNGISARAAGMGSALVAVGGGSESIWFNPAGIAYIQGYEAGLHHNTWLVDTAQENLSLGMNMGSLGGVALAVGYVNFGSFDVRDTNGFRTGSMTPTRLSLGGTWGKELIPGLALGVGARGIRQDLITTSDMAFSFDAGGLWKPSEWLSVGAAYTNLGTSLGQDTLASTLRLGVALEFKFFDRNQTLLAASTNYDPAGTTRVKVGLEHWAYETVAVRAGYNLSLEDNGLDGLTGATFGMGLRVRQWVVDYAFEPFGDLGSGQRVSLTYQFNGKKIIEKTLVLKTETSATQSVLNAVPEEAAAQKSSADLELKFSLPPDVYKKGKEHEKAKRYEEAAGSYTEAIRNNSDDALAWMGLGRVQYKLGRINQTIQAFEQVLRIQPQRVKLRGLVNKLKKRGDVRQDGI